MADLFFTKYQLARVTRHVKVKLLDPSKFSYQDFFSCNIFSVNRRTVTANCTKAQSSDNFYLNP